MPLYDYRCPECGRTENDVPRKIADRDDAPVCCAPMERFYPVGSRANICDEIPGGVWIENLGPHQKWFDSKSAMLREAKRQGLEPFVRHQPLQGGDWSPHTTDWSKGSIDRYTLESAAALVRDRSKGVNASDSPNSDYDSAIRKFNYEATVDEARFLVRHLDGKGE